MAAEDTDYYTQKFRVVHLMECAPGRLSSGQPISIIQFAHLGEVEKQMCLSLWDTRRLAKDLLVVLATHEDDLGLKLLEEWHEALPAGPDWAEISDPSLRAWPVLAPPLPAKPTKKRKRKNGPN